MCGWTLTATTTTTTRRSAAVQRWYQDRVSLFSNEKSVRSIRSATKDTIIYSLSPCAERTQVDYQRHNNNNIYSIQFITTSFKRIWLSLSSRRFKNIFTVIFCFFLVIELFPFLAEYIRSKKYSVYSAIQNTQFYRNCRHQTLRHVTITSKVYLIWCIVIFTRVKRYRYKMYTRDVIFRSHGTISAGFHIQLLGSCAEVNNDGRLPNTWTSYQGLKPVLNTENQP